MNLPQAELTDIHFSGTRISNVNLTDVEREACETKGMKIRRVLVPDLFEVYRKKD